VTLIASGPRGIQTVGGVDVFCVPMPKAYLIRQLIFHTRVLSLIMRSWSSIDVILFHEMSTSFILPLRLIRLITKRDRPLLAMDTRTLFMTGPDQVTGRDRLRQLYLDMMTRASNQWADGRLAITARMARAVEIPQGKLWGVWPSGVNPDEFSKAIARRTWPSAGDAVRLIYIGALQHERNLFSMCAAVQEANSKGTDFELVIAGEGTIREQLKEIADSSANKIQIRDRVPHSQIPYLLSEAHVGVLPFADELKFRVSSPIKLFEYMAAGLPIMATRIACHVDVATDGGYVFWAGKGLESDLVCALCHIWENRSSLQELSKEAVAAAERWTWANSAKELERALRKGLCAV
jgi:glycosyltransferase involved in cell wall biosynthesis